MAIASASRKINPNNATTEGKKKIDEDVSECSHACRLGQMVMAIPRGVVLIGQCPTTDKLETNTDDVTDINRLERDMNARLSMRTTNLNGAQPLISFMS